MLKFGTLKRFEKWFHNTPERDVTWTPLLLAEYLEILWYVTCAIIIIIVQWQEINQEIFLSVYLSTAIKKISKKQLPEAPPIKSSLVLIQEIIYLQSKFQPNCFSKFYMKKYT